MCPRTITFFVTFGALVLGSGPSWAQVFCPDAHTDAIVTPAEASCYVGSPYIPWQCVELRDEQPPATVSARLNDNQRHWRSAVRRGVVASSWDVNSVWTLTVPQMVTAAPTAEAPSVSGLVSGAGSRSRSRSGSGSESESSPEFAEYGFRAIRLCPDAHTGAPVAIVTISPSQLMLLSWRIRNDVHDVAAESPYVLDLNTSQRLYQRVESDIRQCHDALLPLLERIVTLSLENKGVVAPIKHVVLRNHEALKALVPDCSGKSHTKENDK